MCAPFWCHRPPTHSVTSRLETSRYQDFFHFFEGIGISLNKFGLEKVSVSVSKKSSLKKSLCVSLKILVLLKKSLGIGLKNLGLKKVSALVSKDSVSKKSLKRSRKKWWFFTFFKIESESPIYYSLSSSCALFQRDTSNTLKRFCPIKCFNGSLKKFGLMIGLDKLQKVQRIHGIENWLI